MTSGPQSLAAVDLNDDGLVDLVGSVYTTSQGIVTRLGQPDGSLGPILISPTSGYPWSQTVGRFITGAPPGIVVGTQQAELYFHAGNGDGTFQAGLQIAPNFLYELTTIDIDQDGKEDLVGIRGDFAAIVVHLGNGNGTFHPAIATTPLSTIRSFAVGDIDGDGTPDLVVADADGSLEISHGLANGTFGPPSLLPVGGYLRSPTLVDLDGDDAPDIVVANDTGIFVLLNNGDGTFQAGTVVFATGYVYTGIVFGDFDRNGTVDMATLQDGSLLLLLGEGDGTFVPGGQYLLPGQASDGIAADFHSDGNLDLVTGGTGYDALSGATLTRGRGDGTFDAVPVTWIGGGGNPAASADFDEDGRPDIGVVKDAGKLSVYLSSGQGRFTLGSEYDLGQQYGAGVAAGDFDGDGHADIAIVFQSSPGITILRGHGDGTFSPMTVLPVSAPGNQFFALAKGDFDGNGSADLAAAYRIANGNNGEIAVLLSRGSGVFDPAPVVAVPAFFTIMAAADLRGNGRSDLLGVEFPSLVLQVLLGNGDGTFAPAVPYDAGYGTQSIATGDFHQSGHLDVALGRYDQTLALLPGLGDGTLGEPAIIGLGTYSNALAVADFDADGLLDLAAGGMPGVVLFGAGSGTFRSPLVYPSLGASAIFAADFEGTGVPEPVFVNAGLFTLRNGALGVRVPDAGAVVGTSATLTARASGFGPLTYQWRKGGVPLSDGGSISGSHSGTLTIDPVSFGDAGSYDVLVTDSCGTAGSNSAALSVEFADVPLSSPFHADILAVAAAGITAGCGGGNYCPAAPVRRDQMAVFLLKSEHGPAYAPPDCAGTFADVACPGSFTNWVEQLAAEGVTSGCGGGNYCPANSVTRAQMAVFLLKTSFGSGYVPPAATGVFHDVPVGAFAADFIEDLYNRAISGGCSASPLLYCPDNPVLRQQMATFLVRTFAP